MAQMNPNFTRTTPAFSPRPTRSAADDRGRPLLARQYLPAEMPPVSLNLATELLSPQDPAKVERGRVGLDPAC